LFRLTLRAAWVAGAWALTCAVIGHWQAWAIAFDDWLVLGLVAFPVLLIVFALWPVSLPGLVQRLDATLGAHDQLSAAREVAERGPQNYIEARLLTDAESLLTQARLPRVALPWRDVELGLVVIALGFALRLNLAPLGATLPAADYVPLPALGQEPTVSLPGLPPELNLGQSAPFTSPEEAQANPFDIDPATAQEALDALAQALSQSAATQPAASQIAQGNAQQAAADVRQLAESAQSLDPDTRAQLANQLEQSADQLQSSAPQVAEQLQQIANDLRNPDPARAQDALAALARLVEDLNGKRNSNAQAGGVEGDTNEGNQTPGVGSSSTAGREVETGAASDRIESEGEIVRLPQEEAVSEAGILQGPSYDPQATASGTTLGSAQGEGSGAGGSAADPLSYPWQWRNVVQGYFSNQ
jgi:HPt (histidine-containing phosphotransfer) domain-containing protein